MLIKQVVKVLLKVGKLRALLLGINRYLAKLAISSKYFEAY